MIFNRYRFVVIACFVRSCSQALQHFQGYLPWHSAEARHNHLRCPKRYRWWA